MSFLAKPTKIEDVVDATGLGGNGFMVGQVELCNTSEPPRRRVHEIAGKAHRSHGDSSPILQKRN